MTVNYRFLAPLLLLVAVLFAEPIAAQTALPLNGPVNPR